jgi:hypothetical protein
MDFFFMDQDKTLIHLVTAGGLSEKYKSISIEEHDLLTNYLLSLPHLCDVSIHPELFTTHTFANEVAKDRYVESFVSWARRGFYSFDKTDISNPEDKKFHLVAVPLNPLRFENLELKIQVILEKMQIETFVENAAFIL